MSTILFVLDVGLKARLRLTMELFRWPLPQIWIARRPRLLAMAGGRP